MAKNKVSMEVYNLFCSNLKEGFILYNLDSSNGWGKYFLVVSVATIKIGGEKTYSVLLLGLRKEEENFLPRNVRILLTPDYASNVPFLQYVGKCGFKLVPELKDIKVNMGLIAVYGSTNLKQYSKSISIHKPKRRKYGKDGKLVIKNVENQK